MKCSLEAHEEFKEAYSTLEAQRQSPWRWSPRRHDMKAFNGLGPFVIVLRVRIQLGKARDHSLICASISACVMYICEMYVDACYICMLYVYRWMYASFNVCMRYIY